MPCQCNTVDRCHSCCTPVTVQIPGIQGASITWESVTEEEKVEITNRIFNPIKEETSSTLAKATEAAESASTNATIAKQCADTVVANLNFILSEITTEGDHQVARIKNELNTGFAAAGVGGAEETWVLDSDLTSGASITLPSDLKYIVGRHHIRVSWNGIVLTLGEQFKEVGADDTYSTEIVFMFDLSKGDVLNAWISPLGVSGASGNAALEAVAELSRKVVYKSEEAAGS